MHFLLRRMFENYLLDLDRVFGYFTDIFTEFGQALKREDFDRMVAEKSKEKRYFAGKNVPGPESVDWLRDIDGANFLKDLLEGLSEPTIVYSKTEHSVGLSERILKENPEFMRELAEQIDAVLSGSDPA